MSKVTGSWINQQGYIMVKLSNHKCIALHLLIWKNITGHKVPKGMELHHLDHDKYRNCIGNFKLLPAVDHSRWE